MINGKFSLHRQQSNLILGLTAKIKCKQSIKHGSEKINNSWQRHMNSCHLGKHVINTPVTKLATRDKTFKRLKLLRQVDIHSRKCQNGEIVFLSSLSN